MRRRSGYLAVALVLVAAAVGVLAYDAGLFEVPGEDANDRAVVTIVDENGTTLATVEAAVADTRQERVRGLRGATPLPQGTGMLFVHEAEGRYSYVMGGVSFPLDMIFVGADGRVNTIHHAAVVPENESSPTYTGRAKWVLEVPRGFAATHGITPGDRVEVRYPD